MDSSPKSFSDCIWKEAVRMIFLKKQQVFNKEFASTLNGTVSDSANVCELHLDPVRESWQLHLPSVFLWKQADTDQIYSIYGTKLLHSSNKL